MNELKLTDSQKERIEEIRAKWMKEVDEIPEPQPPYNHLDGAATTAIAKLQSKYLPMIKAIIEENNA